MRVMYVYSYENNYLTDSVLYYKKLYNIVDVEEKKDINMEIKERDACRYSRKKRYQYIVGCQAKSKRMTQKGKRSTKKTLQLSNISKNP